MNIETYQNLITSQHKHKPKFMASLTALLKPLQEIEEVFKTFPSHFHIDTAIGVQLDQIGAWVGFSRYVKIPLTNIFFMWNEQDQGFNEGIFKDKFEDSNELVRLTDDVYRTFIKGKIVSNSWDGTLPPLYENWNTVFGRNNSLFVFDNQNMSIIVGLIGLWLAPVYKSLLLQNYLPIKPEGVRIQYYIVVEENQCFFGFNVETEVLAGFGKGAFPMVYC